MRLLARAEFNIGSDCFYPEERPARRACVDKFWIDETPVTNLQFAAFVHATNYQTLAELAPRPDDYPGLTDEMARPGSLVFEAPTAPINLQDPRAWWRFVFGACWRHPLGPDSSIDGLADHPVVHVAYQDALAYATWAGKSLPSEAEWEYAARGGLDSSEFAWGDEFAPNGALLANTWQGEFPVHNELLDGWERTSPVRAFPPNGFGLFDLIGNVWEWTIDRVDTPATSNTRKRCCSPTDPDYASNPIEMPSIARKVLKGGSHLCAPNYCQRYRPAARIPQAVDTSTSHVGFRCVIR
jgi:formylglycine-generating enzyme required for sulfatase activity